MENNEMILRRQREQDWTVLGCINIKVEDILDVLNEIVQGIGKTGNISWQTEE